MPQTLNPKPKERSLATSRHIHQLRQGVGQLASYDGRAPAVQM